MARDFQDGVRFYTPALLNEYVHFPENQLMCKWCPYCKQTSVRDVYMCIVTRDTLYNTDRLGENCPLIIEETTNE